MQGRRGQALILLLGLAIALASPGSLAAAPQAAPTADEVAPKQVKVLVLPIEAGSLTTEERGLFDSSLARALSAQERLDVLSHEDLARALEVEAQRTALGCDDASCLAEVAGAMGADHVVYGRITQLGKNLVLQLNLFDAGRARSVERVQTKAAGLEALLEQLDATATDLVRPLTGAPAPDPAGGWPGLFFYTGAGIGAAGVATAFLGGALLAIAALVFELTTDNGVRGPAQVAAWSGVAMTGVGLIVLGGGIALTAASWGLDE